MMRPARRRGGKIRRQFSPETIERVKAIAADCPSFAKLARRAAREIGLTEHDLLSIEQEERIRFRRWNPRVRQPGMLPECIHPRNPANPGFGRTSPA